MGHPMKWDLLIADKLNLRRRLDDGNVALIRIDPQYLFPQNTGSFTHPLGFPLSRE